MIRDKNTKMERWKVHFSEVLNRETPDNPISEYEEIDIEDIQVDTREIRESEVREAIKKANRKNRFMSERSKMQSVTNEYSKGRQG